MRGFLVIACTRKPELPGLDVSRPGGTGSASNVSDQILHLNEPAVGFARLMPERLVIRVVRDLEQVLLDLQRVCLEPFQSFFATDRHG
jgi:hypothetical protein